MQIVAIAKNIRTSPQKVRLVVDQIKKMKPQEAIDILSFTNKRASLPLKKVISSALANAKHNFGIDQNALAIKSIQVGPGPMFKRFRPISRGRAHSILRKTSHITVVLEGEQSKTDKSNTSDKSDKKEETGGNNGSKS